MRVSMGRFASGAGALALVTAFLVSRSPASGAVTGAVPFSSADFNGYANGTEAHLGAVKVGTTQLVDLDQAFSGASTATGGLTSGIDNEEGAAVQPPQSSSVNSYGRGTGLEVGLGTTNPAITDANQVNLAHRAESTAAPNAAPVTKSIPVSLSPLVTASLVTGRAASFYDTATCPIGQPLSYGFGNAGGVNLLTVPGLVGGGSGSVVSVDTASTSTAQASSDMFLSPNGDGTYGLTSSSSDIIAPVILNLLGLAQVRIAVHNANSDVADPVTLTAKTTGESTGASVKLSTDDVLTATITAGGQTVSLLPNGEPSIPLSAIQKNGLHLPLTLQALPVDLQQVLTGLGNLAQYENLTPLATLVDSVSNQLSGLLGTVLGKIPTSDFDLSFGSIDVDTTPHQINGSATSPAVTVGGTKAAGAIDLIHVQLGVTGGIGGTPLPAQLVSLIGSLVNLAVGHLETSSNLAAAINCQIPVIKTSSVSTVQAGSSFTYTIDVPDPAQIAALACDLSNMTVTDTISDDQASPTFTVTSATQTQGGSAAGTVSPASATSTPVNTATVTWTGLSWKTGTPPDVLSIGIHVPSTSASGRIKDTVIATATLTGCTGGAEGATNVETAVNQTTLSGSYTLHAPGVGVAAAKQPSALPFTGAMGGYWQPVAGLVVLGLGGSALALGLRARRRRT
jgi:hypothetical protein